jgi:predicted RNA-binding Zn-ribbon protein involved in translation (DUF1610 family)
MKLFGSARQALKSVKHGKPSLIFCPKCGSPDLRSSSGFAGIDMWLTPRKYFCEKCGYVGPIYMELEKEEKEDGNEGVEV